MDDLLERLERYFDAVPRADSRTEDVGPFTLFVRNGSYPYYARPSLGASSFTADDVRAVRERQRQLGVSQALEWVEQVSPGLAEAAEAGGLQVHRHPLMVLDGPLAALRPADAEVSMVEGSEDLAEIDAVQGLGFAAPGTAAGETGLSELDAALEKVSPERVADQRDLAERGLIRRAVARADGRIVSAGGHKPVGEVTEIVGVATLPAYRRRGLGAAVTYALAADAVQRGVRTVVLSAGDEDVARMYGSLGFVSVGTACIAEPAG